MGNRYFKPLPPRCHCGKEGTVKMGNPEIPRQDEGESYWMCQDHAAACRYLVPWDTILTQQAHDREYSCRPKGCVVDCQQEWRSYGKDGDEDAS